MSTPVVVVPPQLVLQSIVAFMNNALRDPGDPKSCWGCLAGAFHVLLKPQDAFGPGVEADFVFTKSCTIWPTILAFVTSPRTNQELADLATSRQVCDCGQGEGARLVRDYGRAMLQNWSTAWKEEAPSVASSPFHCFFSWVFKELTPYLHDVSPTAVAKRRTEAWPFSPQDCLPFGADTTVKSLHQWIHFYRDPQPFAISLLGVIGHVSRSLVVPTIASAPYLAADIAKIGHTACDETSRLLLKQSLTDAEVMAIGDGFHRRMWHIEKFWKCLIAEANIGETDLKRLFEGNERSLFDMFSKALGHLHTPAFFCDYVVVELLSDSIHAITDAAATMYVLGGLVVQIPPTPRHMRPDILAAVLRKGKEWGYSPQEPAVVPAGTILKFSKDRNVCFSLGCHRSIQMLDPAAVPEDRFRRCSGCQLVSYCGRECQLAAWRDNAVPHRDICGKIKAVIKQGGGDVDDLAKWRARAKKGDIDEGLARAVVDWFNKWDTMQRSKCIAN